MSFIAIHTVKFERCKMAVDRKVLGLAELVDQPSGSLQGPPQFEKFIRKFQHRKNMLPTDLGSCARAHLEVVFKTRAQANKECDYRQLAIRFITSCMRSAERMAMVYLLILHLRGHLPDDGLWDDFHAMYTKYLAYALCGRLEKYLKYHTAWCASVSIRNQAGHPPRDLFIPWEENDGYFLSVRLSRRVRVHLLRKGGVALGYELYQAKNASLDVSPEFVAEAMEKNLRLLTEERSIYADGSMDDYVRLAHEVIRTAEEVKKGRKLVSVPKIPSTSASFMTARKAGGALGELVRSWSCPGLCPEEFSISSPEKSLFVAAPSSHEIDEKLRGSSPDSQGVKLTTGIPCRRSPVLEPFKVRVVSMGDAALYQRARSFQPRLLSWIQEFDCFALTGRPESPQDIEQVVEFGKDLFGDNFELVSGDYSAATDNICPYLAEEAMEVLARGLPRADINLMLSSLTGHIVSGKPQRWGQLMGSPLSFPILCIINAAITRHVLEIVSGRRIRLKDLGILINGDDILFPLRKFALDEDAAVDGIEAVLNEGRSPIINSLSLWTRLVTRGGLQPSVGKNYVSRSLCTINSRLFEVCRMGDVFGPRDFRVRCVVRRVPYINTGLLFSMDGSTFSRGVTVCRAGSREKTLRERVRELVYGHPQELGCKLVTEFLYQSEAVLRRIPKVSYWTAFSLGGLGLPYLRPGIAPIARHHLRLSSFLSCLTAEVRREQYKMRWLREPGRVFTKEVLQQVERLGEMLGLPLVPSTEDEEDCPLLGRLLRVSIFRGVDEETVSAVGFLKGWRRWYESVQKKAMQTTLEPMGPLKAQREFPYKLVRSWSECTVAAGGISLLGAAFPTLVGQPDICHSEHE